MTRPIINKDIEINKRNFRLNKMNARTGSFMLFKLVKVLTPLLKNVNLDKTEEFNLDDINLTEALSSIMDLPEDEFRYIQDNCLMVVEELLPAGPARVLNTNKEFGVLDMEFDVVLLMELTIKSLVFNVSGFFKEGRLGSLLKGSNISQQNSAT